MLGVTVITITIKARNALRDRMLKHRTIWAVHGRNRKGKTLVPALQFSNCCGGQICLSRAKRGKLTIFGPEFARFAKLAWKTTAR